MKRSDMAELLLLAALWGASYLFMRLGAAEFGAFALAGVRSLVAVLIMVPLVAWRGEVGVWRMYWKDILVVGFTNSALPFVLFSFAALSIAAGLSAVINATVPLFAALIGWLWLKDRLTPTRVAGLAIGFAGVVWLVAGKASFKPGASHVGWAIVACLAATFLYGFSANFSKRRLADAAPVAVAAGGHLVSAVVLFVPMLALWPATSPSPRAWSAALALAVFCTAFAYVLYYRLIANVGASRTVTVAYLIPVFGVLWGALFLGESFTLDMALGCAVILVGVALTTGLVALRPKLLAAACAFVVCLPSPVRANEGQARAEAAGRSIVGTPAPRATLTTLDGGRIDLAALYGRKAVYLKFWATWCSPCREQMPHFQHAFDAAGDDLAVIGVNAGFSDPIEDVRAFVAEKHLTMPTAIDDGGLSEALNLRVTPTHVVIGRDGRVKYVGHLADARLDVALVAARAPAAEVAAATAPAATVRVGVGDALPALDVQTLAGKTFKPMPGRRTVLVFLSPWCESYLATTRPNVSASCRAVREETERRVALGGATWLGIASGLWADRDDLVKYRDENKIALPLTLDASGDLFRRFGVASVPTVVVVDAQGRIARRVEGRDASVRDALAAALAQ